MRTIVLAAALSLGVSSANAGSCNDTLKNCAQKVKTHTPDKNGCMPVECKAGTKDASFRYVKDEKLKAQAIELEKAGEGNLPIEKVGHNKTQPKRPTPAPKRGNQK